MTAIYTVTRHHYRVTDAKGNVTEKVAEAGSVIFDMEDEAAIERGYDAGYFRDADVGEIAKAEYEQAANAVEAKPKKARAKKAAAPAGEDTAAGGDSDDVA